MAANDEPRTLRLDPLFGSMSVRVFCNACQLRLDATVLYSDSCDLPEEGPRDYEVQYNVRLKPTCLQCSKYCTAVYDQHLIYQFVICLDSGDHRLSWSQQFQELKLEAEASECSTLTFAHKHEDVCHLATRVGKMRGIYSARQLPWQV